MALWTESSTTRRWRAALLVAGLVLFASARAQAEAISYSLTVCESLEVLEDPMNKTLAMNVAWQPQHTLMLARTMPFFELRNTAEEAVITQLSMTIGDMSLNFDWSKLIEASPGVTFSLVTPDSVVGGSKDDTLVINFDGFAPGDFVRFRAGLSPDDANLSKIQDYRMALFRLGGDDPSGNSVVSVQFQSDQGDETLVQQMPNFDMGMPTSTSMAFPNHYMDSIMPFTLTGQGTIESDPDEVDEGDGEPEVPEPGSFALLGSGLAGLIIWRIRRRRRTAERSSRLAGCNA
jgi:hypothetical protein